MDKKLDILLLEDVESDAELIEYELRKLETDFTLKRVDTREGFLEEITERPPNIILADYSLPAFDGLSALALTQGMRPELPFIFVSGAMGEEVAVDTLKQGATDYVLKQNLGRLGSSVIRAMREAEERGQRRQAEASLRESEERFRTLFETAGSFIGVTTPGGLLLEVNPEAERVSGWPRQEVLGRNFLDLYIPQTFREAVQTYFQKVLAGQAIRGFEMPLKLRFGGERPFIWNVNRLLGKEGQILGVMAVGQDIAARKQAEEDLRESEQNLRLLASQILTAQENERKRISRELHDELGQSLTILKLNLRAAARQLQEPVAVKEELGSLSLYLDEVIDKVRRLSRALSPAILEDLGLAPALQYLVNEFSKYYDINHHIDLENLDLLFDKEAQIIIFRIFQEALTNIVRHAQATKVRLAIQESGGMALFEVEDNGQGFEVSEIVSSSAMDRGLGLVALDERAKMLGGSLRIESRKGVGTHITCAVPVGQKSSGALKG